MTDYILNLQAMELEEGAQEGTLGSTKTSVCCKCSWLSTLGC